MRLVSKHFTRRKAQCVANRLNADRRPGWSYRYYWVERNTTNWLRQWEVRCSG